MDMLLAEMMRASFPLDTNSAFRQSMPERYRAAFSEGDAGEHAAIVSRRGEAPVHVEVWKQQADQARGVSAICVVADDRPGLLSFICASLVMHHLDVVSAHAYTRRPAGGPPGSPAMAEAVDFLWVRRDAGSDHAMPLLEADVERVASVIRQLLTGELTIEAAIERARPARAVPPGASTRVTFDEDGDAGLVVLNVETFDRPGLLLAITAALFRANVQIISSEALTRAGRVIDRFAISEVDGSPIRSQRRGLVQIEVLGAIDALSRGR